MARLLAIDWDHVEARMIVARTQGDSLSIDEIVAVPLKLDMQETAEDIERQLAQAIGAQRFAKCQAMTAVGRSLVELRVLSLPPAPDDELPEMVRFQGLREFSSLQEDSPLDFVPLGSAGQEPGEVMAAAISSELAGGVARAVSGAGHESRRVILRPCAAASLAMRRCAGARLGVTLVIGQQADAAELAIAKDGMVVFTRSVRLPENWHPGESGEPLLGEARRTIAAAQNQLGGARVQHIVFFGTPEEHGGLCERLKERTELDVELIDPFAGLTVGGSSPAQPERFAALLGMLQDEASDVRPVIDFANPRKKAVPESNRRLHLLLAATAATIVFAIAAMGYMKYAELGKEVSSLNFERRQFEEETLRLKPVVELAEELRTWKSSDRSWLDELYHLSSSESLSAEDFRIDTINAVAPTGRPSTLTLSGWAKDVSASSRMQQELTDEVHDVVPGRFSRSDEDSRYPFTFRTVVETRDSIPLVAEQAVSETPDSETSDDAAPATQESTEAGASS